MYKKDFFLNNGSTLNDAANYSWIIWRNNLSKTKHLLKILLFSIDLREVYSLKEVFYRFMRSKDRQEGEKGLRELCIHVYIVHIPEFKASLTVLQNWESDRFNTFFCLYSNEFTKNINNTIKVILIPYIITESQSPIND